MSDSEEKKVEKAVEKLSVEDKERLMARLQKDIKLYEDSEKDYSVFEETALKRIDFTAALLYGLIYGIMGNLLIQSLLPFGEGIILARYDTTWYSLSLPSFLSSVIALVIVTWKLRQELKEEKRNFDAAWSYRVASQMTKEDLQRLWDYLKNN